eukprot:PhM_4_TR9271/c0_g1_i1/m.81332
MASSQPHAALQRNKLCLTYLNGLGLCSHCQSRFGGDPELDAAGAARVSHMDWILSRFVHAQEDLDRHHHDPVSRSMNSRRSNNRTFVAERCVRTSHATLCIPNPTPAPRNTHVSWEVTSMHDIHELFRRVHVGSDVSVVRSFTESAAITTISTTPGTGNSTTMNTPHQAGRCRSSWGRPLSASEVPTKQEMSTRGLKSVDNIHALFRCFDQQRSKRREREEPRNESVVRGSNNNTTAPAKGDEWPRLLREIRCGVREAILVVLDALLLQDCSTSSPLSADVALPRVLQQLQLPLSSAFSVRPFIEDVLAPRDGGGPPVCTLADQRAQLLESHTRLGSRESNISQVERLWKTFGSELSVRSEDVSEKCLGRGVGGGVSN